MNKIKPNANTKALIKSEHWDNFKLNIQEQIKEVTSSEIDVKTLTKDEVYREACVNYGLSNIVGLLEELETEVLQDKPPIPMK